MVELKPVTPCEIAEGEAQVPADARELLAQTQATIHRAMTDPLPNARFIDEVNEIADGRPN
jgi:hypothetical protein